jgi:squalene synthase HpnC
MAIYGFARLVDDIGDEVEGDRMLLLDRAEDQLRLAFSGDATHAVFRELAPTIRACRLEQQPFLDLIQANRQDQTVDRYETFEELKGYCRLSADPVGRLVLAVTGELTPERVGWSDRVCTGLQLVEHWQDLGEDARRDRIYLPQEDLRAFGVSEGDLLASSAAPELRRLVAFEAGRARGLLEAARPLAKSLRGRTRVAISGFAAGGLAALDAIEAAGFDVLGRPVKGKKRRLFLHSLRLLVGTGVGT